MDEWVGKRSVPYGYGCSVSEDQIVAYVRTFRKHKEHARALELMDWMEARGAKLRRGHHALRLGLVSKVHGIQAAEEYFSNLPDIFKSIETYSCLLSCYAEHRMADKGLELYEKMKAMYYVPNKLIYNNLGHVWMKVKVKEKVQNFCTFALLDPNTPKCKRANATGQKFCHLPICDLGVHPNTHLMSLYQKAGQLEKIPSTFEEMQGSGISADKFTYFTLIESYLAMNDLDAAEKVLEELQKAAPVHWSLYTLMAKYYIKLELFGKAEVALKKAEEVMDKAELHCWHFLLTLYARSGNSTGVRRIWESLKSTFKKCLNRSYLVMLRALSMVDDFVTLQRIFQEWQSSHEYYDMRVANFMIKAFVDKGMIDEAEAIRQSAMAQGHCNEDTFYIFAESHLGKSNVNAALEILRNAKKTVTASNWVPSKELMSRFLKHYEESKDVDGVESFCECLRKLECLDAEAYMTLMRTYIAAGRTNPCIAHRMQNDGIHIEPEMAKLLKSVSGS